MVKSNSAPTSATEREQRARGEVKGVARGDIDTAAHQRRARQRDGLTGEASGGQLAGRAPDVGDRVVALHVGERAAGVAAEDQRVTDVVIGGAGGAAWTGMAGPGSRAPSAKMTSTSSSTLV